MRQSLNGERKAYIYQINNLVNGKQYIGITSQFPPEKRWRQHISISKKSSTTIISLALRKYGPENFDFLPFGVLKNRDAAGEAEKYFIKKYKPEYNCTSGGDIGYIVSPLSIEKMSKSLTGKKRFVSPEEREALIKKCHIFNANKKNNPKPNSEKQINAARISGKKRRKPVLCIEDNLFFDSAAAAAKHYNVSFSLICRSCRTGITAAKKKFKYTGKK